MGTNEGATAATSSESIPGSDAGASTPTSAEVDQSAANETASTAGGGEVATGSSTVAMNESASGPTSTASPAESQTAATTTPGTPIDTPAPPTTTPGAATDSPSAAGQDLFVEDSGGSSSTEFPAMPTRPADNLVYSEEVDAMLDELAAEYPDYTRAELEQISRDPNGNRISESSVRETRTALEAERMGVVSGPIQPAEHTSHDFVDGDGQEWDVKAYDSRDFNLQKALDRAATRDLPNGENLLIDTRNLSEEDIVALETALENDPRFADRYEFVPPR